MKPDTGVLIVNLGTPDAPTPDAIKRYLAEFLSDRRVVPLPPILWQPILRGIVLTTRPKKSAEAYEQVWTERGSPLAVITADQAETLQQRLPNVRVCWAMRYGNPAIASVLEEMAAAGSRRVLVVPMYPQYCTATTASALDALDLALAKMLNPPEVRVMESYYNKPDYISALTTTIQSKLSELNFVPDRLIASFHGMPERTREQGDPYYDQCQATKALLANRLGRNVTIAFQSRFGKAKWLEPALDKMLSELPRKGIKRIAIVAPGFSADCVETLEEIAIRGRENFLHSGGTDFAYIPCLNAGLVGADMLENLVRSELGDWCA